MNPQQALAIIVDRIARDIAVEVYGFGHARTAAHYSSESIEHEHQKIARVAVYSFLRQTADIRADPVPNDAEPNDAEALTEMMRILGKKP